MNRARQKRRRRVMVVMATGVGLPIVDALLGLSRGAFAEQVFDEGFFMQGRLVGAIHFSLIYLCILSRLLAGTRWRLGPLLLPMLFLLVVVGGVAGGSFIYLRSKEITEVLGFAIEGFAVRQMGVGVVSMMPTIAFVMIATPVVIPAAYLHRLGELFSKDIRTGHLHFDDYLRFSKKNIPKHSTEETPATKTPVIEEDHPEVLLVEDDLACAALVLKFCHKLKLDCQHVESLDEAKPLFDQHRTGLRLLILDNFVRVGPKAQEEGVKTGSQWAQQINAQWPNRNFHIAILTGHTHMLADLEKEADIVLQKPWEPQQLFRYLKDRQVV